MNKGTTPDIEILNNTSSSNARVVYVALLPVLFR
jgi:hypothetical protein